MARVLPTEMSTSRYKDERNAFVMESLQQAAPMMRNFAVRYRDVLLAMDADFDDLYQNAAEWAFTNYENVIYAKEPRVYMQKVIRNACVRYLNLTKPKNRKQTLSDHYQIVSLNKPLCIDSEETLEDVMVAIDYISKEYPQEVYAAIESLPEKYYVPLCMRYGLFDCPPHSYDEMVRILGLPKTTVCRYVTKAVELLRERLSEEVLRG